MSDTDPRDKYSSDDPAVDPDTGLLRNKLGLATEDALDRAERRANEEAFERLALSFDDDHSFTAEDVRLIHREMFGEVFEWAGEYRRIDISSPNIRWCHARFIESEMRAYEKRLGEMTPFSPTMTRDEIVQRLAVLHAELVVIHPFRDGNGRTTRMLDNLLLMQAERSPIRPEAFYAAKLRQGYFGAIQEAWAKQNYGRLETVLRTLIPGE